MHSGNLLNSSNTKWNFSELELYAESYFNSISIASRFYISSRVTSTYWMWMQLFLKLFSKLNFHFPHLTQKYFFKWSFVLSMDIMGCSMNAALHAKFSSACEFQPQGCTENTGCSFLTGQRPWLGVEESVAWIASSPKTGVSSSHHSFFGLLRTLNYKSIDCGDIICFWRDLLLLAHQWLVQFHKN